jgi:hypothetical protein
MADGDAPPGFAAVARRSTQAWARQNTKLLTYPASSPLRNTLEDPLGNRALGSIVTGSIGGIAREVAACETKEEADGLIAKAIEIYGMLLGLGTPVTPR